MMKGLSPEFKSMRQVARMSAARYGRLTIDAQSACLKCHGVYLMRVGPKALADNALDFHGVPNDADTSNAALCSVEDAMSDNEWIRALEEVWPSDATELNLEEPDPEAPLAGASSSSLSDPDPLLAINMEGVDDVPDHIPSPAIVPQLPREAPEELGNFEVLPPGELHLESSESVPVPSEKRRKVGEKHEPEAKRIYYQFLQGENDIRAVIPVKLGTSRISRELNENVYVVNWGQSKDKPQNLHLWGCDEEGGSPGRPPILQAIAGKEDGHVYYSSKALSESASAMWVLEHCASLSEAYSRMMLLFSPTSCTIALPPKVSVEFVPKRPNNVGVDPRDGQAELSMALARKLGLIRSKSASGDPVFPAWQMRGMVFVPALNKLCLVKGMLTLNKALLGLTLVLPESTCKVRGAMTHMMPLGLEITKTSEKGFQAPRLTASLLSVLRLRALTVDDPRQRENLLTKLDSMIEARKALTREKLPSEAYLQDDLSKSFFPSGSKDLRSERLEQEKIPRTPASSIDVTVIEEVGSPTPLEVLSVTSQEVIAHDIRLGTKEALLRGGLRLASLAKRESLTLDSRCHTLFALTDVTDTLRKDQCYVISDGFSLVGKVAVWRCPCQLPWDAEVWEAVELPKGALAPENCIVVSREGYCNSRMAGGDFDGDLNMVSWDPLLVDFLHETNGAVSSCNISLIEANMKLMFSESGESIWKRAEGTLGRSTEYVQYVLEVPTPQLRGVTCAYSERAAHRAFLERNNPEQREATLKWALRLGVLSHMAMDAPKTFSSKAVMAALRYSLRKAGITRAMERSTVAVTPLLEAGFYVDSRAPENSVSVMEFLTGKLDGIDLGRVWLPNDSVCLSGDAGEAMAEALSSVSFGATYSMRSLVRSPLMEVALLLKHRAQGLKSGGDAEALFKVFKNCRKRKMNMGSLRHSVLP